MGSDKWKKAKQALGCILIPQTLEQNNDNINININGSVTPSERRRVSDAGVSLSSTSPSDVIRPPSPMTPTPSSQGLMRFSRTCSKSSSKKTCAICLNSMIPGQGLAIFTAECSHSFHFNCITSNVKHGNRVCPVCRAKWKEIPFQSRTPGPREKLRGNMPSWNRNDLSTEGNHLQASEPGIYDDDDFIEEQRRVREQSVDSTSDNQRIEIRTCPEVSAIPKSISYADFTVLIHLKAPIAGSQNSRAPVDLVTVLDVSGSMAGTKLALLKRAMGFVIQHLGPHDRLSVIAFSATARRLFPLRRMNDIGRHQALQAVNSLSSNGGTNIAEGLKKGAKVMLDRKCKNPVSSIILLSDGQDTYTVMGPGGAQSRTDYNSLLPSSIQQSLQIPVHTFGFGVDHDAVAMHSISEASGGTFSFIEVESVIQDAFAQCMGGLLSVVTQELLVSVECVHPTLELRSIEAGSYFVQLTDNARLGQINVGDLYAEEDKHFLATLNIPKASINEMPLLKVNCSYRDPLTNNPISLDEVVVKIDRPETQGPGPLVVSIEVDRQRNRLRAAEAMSEAKSVAEGGDLAGAILILERCREMLSASTSTQAGDPMTVGLGNELREIQERMCNRQIYEASGRAYVLSGLSSHSWQRATARGDTTSSTSLSQVYQTTMMADMITRSQTMVFGNVPSLPVAPPRSLSQRLSPRALAYNLPR
ncbi:E3 ubiquitin-protein ligase WAV3-like isoform X2 [Silene latifolia]|uniref:E3 ubiquitin-protein ligase WAV3-like isoform X2 n=1 Tax=Silene latifolia TaxID=37657 RepID=UPI003D77C83C